MTPKAVESANVTVEWPNDRANHLPHAPQTSLPARLFQRLEIDGN
jgi:hypothetical protein